MIAHRNPLSRSCDALLLTLLSAGLCVPSSALAQGRFAKWSPIELTFIGPDSRGTGTPNPFAIRLDCRFTSPAGEQYIVPGFYAGDGDGGLDGNLWKVRFSADREGTWSYETASSQQRLDGRRGRVTVDPVRSNAEGFWRWGRLEHVGTAEDRIRYLKFRDGPYWLKAGCDDPENFLGSYEHYDTPAERRGAVDYLAGRGINSLYVMTHNLDGDDDDVWPWLGRTSEQARSNGGRDARFDVARLDEWRALFEHMQARGVVPYLVLEDDSAWSGYDHDRYFREIIARFGDLPALIFNLGEEHDENYSLAEGLELARRFRAIDPYRHPLGVHNVNRANDAYVSSPDLDLTSIQTGRPGRPAAVEHALEHNRIAVDWIEKCEAGGQRVLMVNFDEGRPELDRRAWWSAYLGGGVWEAHVLPPYDQPHSSWNTTWTELGGARRFMESIPFHEMRPRNDVVESGEGFCLAAEGRAYAFYLPHGGEISVDLAPGTGYDCAWWDPGNGTDGAFRPAGRVAGGRQSFTAPAPGDWALRVVRADAPREHTDEVYYPPPDSAGGWRRPADGTDRHRSAEIVGENLDAALDLAKGSTKNGGLLVLRDGWLVYERYFGLGHRDATPNLASCGKSFTSIAVGMLLAERPDLFPDGLDQLVFAEPYLPPEAFPLSDPRKAQIALGQLLAFTAGVRGNNPAYVHGEPTTIEPVGPDGWQGLVDNIALGLRDGRHRDEPFTTSTLWCDPGGGYSYATASIHLASIMLRHVTGVELEDYLADRLAEPLGWGSWGFGYKHAKDVEHTPGGGGIALRATDMLRFGYLLLNEGRWRDRQLIPAEYVRHCGRRSRFNPHFPYSLQFTVNSDGAVDELPRDAFWKSGSGGHALYVVPSLKLAVWKLGGRDSQYATANTGLPPSPASDKDVAERRDWIQSVPHDVAVTETLRLVIDAVRSGAR